MKQRIFILWCFLWTCPFLAHAHVGSPNVFFEGSAGPYPLRVTIRPPAVLPGSAQVDVRTDAAGVTNLVLKVREFSSGAEESPLSVQAASVRGETNLFNGVLWLLRSGSYSVEVLVDGSAGAAKVSVPLNSAALQPAVMSPTLKFVLIALGIMVLLGATILAGAAARDCALEPGVQPRPVDFKRAWAVAVTTVLLLVAGSYAGSLRWRTMDLEFKNNSLSHPLPILATTRTNGALSILHLESFDEGNPAAPTWDSLAADHGKLMHLFLIKQTDFNTFMHLHPVRRDARTFENILPPLSAGLYSLYAEITYENGINQTLLTNITLSGSVRAAPQMSGGPSTTNDVLCQSAVAPIGNADEPVALDLDDSWHSGAAVRVPAGSRSTFCRLMGGYNMMFEPSGLLRENQETSLRFLVFTPNGDSVRLEPYMGMAGHAVVRRTDGQVFTHLHPLGTISMAAQSILTARDSAPLLNTSGQAETINSPPPPHTSSAAINEVAFPYAFPRPGDYRLWVQVRISGRVLTGVFDVIVQPAGT